MTLKDHLALATAVKDVAEHQIMMARFLLERLSVMDKEQRLRDEIAELQPSPERDLMQRKLTELVHERAAGMEVAENSLRDALARQESFQEQLEGILESLKRSIS
jgi:hypothetical protein